MESQLREIAVSLKDFLHLLTPWHLNVFAAAIVSAFIFYQAWSLVNSRNRHVKEWNVERPNSSLVAGPTLVDKLV